MKKLISILVIFTLMYIVSNNYAQVISLPGAMEDDPLETYVCPTDLMNQLMNCLSGHGISGGLIEYDDGIHLIASSADGPYGLFNSCVVQYNNDRVDCPLAPVIILKFDSKSGKGNGN